MTAPLRRLVVLLGLLLNWTASAQSLIPYRKGNLWGYADRQHRVRIAPAYDDVTFFEQGLARVLRDGRWGLLNEQGKLVGPLHFTRLDPFQQGLAAFERRGRTGYLNPQGQEVIVLDSSFRLLAPGRYSLPQSFYRKQGRLVAFTPERGHFFPSGSSAQPATDSDFAQGIALVQRQVKKTGIKSTKPRPSTMVRYYLLNRRGQLLTDSGFTKLERQAGAFLLADGHVLLNAAGRVVFRRPGVMLRSNPAWDTRPALPRGLWICSTTTAEKKSEPTQSGSGPLRLGLVDSTGRLVLPLAYTRLDPLVPPATARPTPGRSFLLSDAQYVPAVYHYPSRREFAPGKSHRLTPVYIPPLGDYLYLLTAGASSRVVDGAGREIVPPSLLIELEKGGPYGLITAQGPGGRFILFNYRGQRLSNNTYLAVNFIGDSTADGVLDRDGKGEFFRHTGKVTSRAALLAHRRYKLRTTCTELSGRSCFRMADSVFQGLPDTLRRHPVQRLVLQGKFLLITYQDSGRYPRSGVIDTMGGLVVPFRYRTVQALRPGYFVASSGYGKGMDLYNGAGRRIYADTLDGHGQAKQRYHVYLLGDRYFALEAHHRTLLIDSVGRIAPPGWLPRIQPVYESPSYTGSAGGGYALFEAGMRPLSGYDFANPPQHTAQTGLTWVHTRGKWGFIDRQNQVRIPFAYEQARAFHEGRAAVSTGGKWGFIDASAQLVIPCRYDSVSDFNSGLALFVNRETERGYLDRDGRPALADKLRIGTAEYGDNNDHLKFIGPPADPRTLYLEAGPFYHGLARVCRSFRNWGFINARGEEVIPCRYRNAQHFTGDFTWVQLRGRQLLLNVNHQVVDSLDVSFVAPFNEYLSVYGLPDYRQPPDCTPAWGPPGQEERTALYVAPRDSQGRGRRLCLREGITIQQVWLRPALDRFPADAGLAQPVVRLLELPVPRSGSQVGTPTASTRLVTLDGALVRAFPDQVVHPFRQGLGRAYFSLALPKQSKLPVGNAVGFLNPEGQVAIPYQYQAAGDFAEDLAPVQLPAQAGFIDLAGRPFYED